MKEKINIGMIGYKFMGKAHSNAFQRIGMFFDIDAKIGMKAICGRNEDQLKEIAFKYGWEGYETSWEKLVTRDDIDAIDIGAPSNVHKSIAIASAENGKHVFCEKPLALNVQDAREILKAVNKYKVKHQIGFNYRFTPAIVLAKQLIDSGKLGEIYHFRTLYLQDWLINPDFPLVWRLDKSIAGAGSLGDLGAHVIDLARYLVGEFDKVIGVSKTFIKERPVPVIMSGLNASAGQNAEKAKVTVDDATIFLAQFKNGVAATFEATRYGNGHRNGMSFEINGSKGSVKFDFERMNELLYYSTEDEEGFQGFRNILATEAIHPYSGAWSPTGHIIAYEHTFVHEFYEFINSIAKDKPCKPDFNDALKCSQLIDAVDKSIKENQWVNVDNI